MKNSGRLRRACATFVVLVLAALFVAVPAPGGSAAESTARPAAAGARPALGSAISSTDVGSLAPKWVFTAHGDTSATPAVVDGVVYFPDFGGYLNAVDAATGALIWQRQVSDYDGVAGAVSRTKPVIAGNLWIFGDNILTYHAGGAHLFGVDRWTGRLVWSTQVESHPAAIITGNPVLYGGDVYVGVSSWEEGLATTVPGYPCCSFRGSVVSVNAFTGRLNWQYYDIPASLDQACTVSDPESGCGYSGGAIWSSPAIDVRDHALVVGTGNNYTVPDSSNACEVASQKNGTSDDACTDPQDEFEAILSIDLTTGALHWSHKVSGFDAWTATCVYQPPGVTWCPSPEGQDYDIGAGANVYTTTLDNVPTTVVGVGQKSGIYWAVRGDTGALVWNTLVGPGSLEGGIQWGTATDGRRIYAPIGDLGNVPYTLVPSGQTDTAGSWSALDANTGKIIWQTADPGSSVAYDIAAPVLTNDVLFAGSLAPTGDNMYALDADTGKILWGFASGGSVAGSPAVVGDTVYWGSGYSLAGFAGATGNDKFYAFSIGGH